MNGQRVGHLHICGDVGEEPGTIEIDSLRGCTFTWRHANGNEDRHMCPNCGRGPWLVKLSPEEEALWARMGGVEGAKRNTQSV